MLHLNEKRILARSIHRSSQRLGSYGYLMVYDRLLLNIHNVKLRKTLRNMLRRWDKSTFKSLVLRMLIHVSISENDHAILMRICRDDFEYMDPRQYKHIYDDIDELYDTYSATYNIKSKVLKFIIPAVELEGVDFGRFEIVVPILMKSGISDYYIICNALEPNFPEGSYDISECHPHVSGSTICLGDYEDIVIKLYECGYMLEFAKIIEGVLNTYNEGNPYLYITAWLHGMCRECGEILDSDEYCRECGYGDDDF